MKQTSLQKQLLLWIMAILLCVGMLAGGFSFFKTYHDLNQLQRGNLKNIAMLFASVPPPRKPIERRFSIPVDRQNRLARSAQRIEKSKQARDSGRFLENKLAVELNSNTNIGNKQNKASDGFNDLSDTGQNVTQYDSKTDGEIRVHVIPLPLERLNPEHLHHIQSRHLLDVPVGFGKMAHKGEDWQSYRINLAHRIIIVRQKASLQEKLAKAGAVQAFMPVMVGILLLLVLLPWLLNRMFKPVRQLSQQVANRDEQDLSAIDIAKDGQHLAVPIEIQPLVTETNQLLVRVNKHIKQQQRFVADSAHELRSPLTAISLQVQRLQRLVKPKDLTAEQVATIREGMDKLAIRVSHNQHLVEQLLTLARIDAQQLNASKTDLLAVLTQAVLLLLPIADNKQIDLEVDNQLEQTNNNTLRKQVNMDETSLMMVLKNLLQNAILYTPKNGQVTVKIVDSHTYLKNNGHLNGLVGITTLEPIKSNLHHLPHKSRLIVQICDTGVGIEPNLYKEAFTPFVRMSDNLKTFSNPNTAKRSDTSAKQDNDVNHVNGTGLGLAIVQQVCQQAGVDIYLSPTIASTKSDDMGAQGKGLTVTLVFA